MTKVAGLAQDAFGIEEEPIPRTYKAVAAERQASAGARDGVKGKGAISLRALRCMR